MRQTCQNILQINPQIPEISHSSTLTEFSSCNLICNKNFVGIQSSFKSAFRARKYRPDLRLTPIFNFEHRYRSDFLRLFSAENISKRRLSWPKPYFQFWNVTLSANIAQLYILKLYILMICSKSIPAKTLSRCSQNIFGSLVSFKNLLKKRFLRVRYRPALLLISIWTLRSNCDPTIW